MALPRFSGRPVRVEIRRSLGPHLAGSSIPRRLILLDRDVLRSRGEFDRILTHELFHFVWVRLGNATRSEWEQILAAELREGVKGELGWSAEWRKAKLSASDSKTRSPKWRRYACESFCDSAAWLYSETGSHDEFTLRSRARKVRADWFRRTFREPGVRI